jgi:hypothetical protein
MDCSFDSGLPADVGALNHGIGDFAIRTGRIEVVQVSW